MVTGDRLVQTLEREIGADRVLSSESALRPYSRDASGLAPVAPEAVVRATSRQEAAAVLELATARGIPVTPRGAGTGLTGGALPRRAGVVLSTEDMSRILEVDEENLVAVVEPGVITGAFRRFVEARGLFYPPDPASLETSTLGGNIAHNAGGMCAFKYGVTRDYVLGLEALSADGRGISTGRRTMKGVAGYDLTALLVGSEGTLGVVTQATLRLAPAPQSTATVLAGFSDLVVAGRAVTEILANGERPRALEFVDRPSMLEVENHTGYHFPKDAGAVLILEIDGDADTFPKLLRALEAACHRAGAFEVVIAVDADEQEVLWRGRRAVYPTLLQRYPRMLTEDVCLPRSAIPAALSLIDQLAARYDIPTATIGHAGDGNLHIGLLRDSDPRDPTDEAGRVEGFKADLLAGTLRLGGTIAGEHGIGHAKRDYLAWEVDPGALALQRRIKESFDPHGLLNPGKVFAETTRG